MVKVVFLDAAGTLFHLPRGVGFHYAQVARRHGANFEEAALNRAFRDVWRNAEPLPESRAPREMEERAWWKAVAGQVFAKCGDGSVIHRCFDELWDEFTLPGIWELYPETREVLVALAVTCRLGVVSNFDSRLHRILAVLGISHFFEHILVSSEVGAEKPSRYIFDTALSRFSTIPAEVLHVGDEAEADWMGARAAGLQAFELRRPENSLRDILPIVRPKS